MSTLFLHTPPGNIRKKFFFKIQPQCLIRMIMYSNFIKQINMKTNLEIVQQAYADFSQGNIPGLLDALSDSIEWELPASANVNFSGMFKGKQQVLHFFECIAATNDFKEFSPETFVADGDHVVVLGHLEATAKPTGKTSANKWAHYWLLKDGKAIRHYEYADTAEIRDAFNN